MKNTTTVIHAPSGVQIVSESALAALNAYGTEKDHKRRAAIYGKDISPRFGEIADMPISASNSPGTLAGTLVTQRALELLKIQYPILRKISTDFRDEGALYGQVVKSRITAIPSVGTYSTTTGYAQTDMVSTDVDVTINSHKYVQLTFNANILSGTVRQLFDEYAPAASNALVGDLIASIYALITAANFTNTPITALEADFSRAKVIAGGKAMSARGVPKGSLNRTLILNSAYFGKLGEDSSIVSLAAFRLPEVITEGVLPPVHGFMVLEAEDLPDNSEYLVGFGLSRSALIATTRLPGDYTKALAGAADGNGIVTTVTEPDTQLSVQQVQFVNHTMGTANQRIALMSGVAKGQDDAGQRFVSQ